MTEDLSSSPPQGRTASLLAQRWLIGTTGWRRSAMGQISNPPISTDWKKARRCSYILGCSCERIWPPECLSSSGAGSQSDGSLPSISATLPAFSRGHKTRCLVDLRWCLFRPADRSSVGLSRRLGPLSFPPGAPQRHTASSCPLQHKDISSLVYLKVLVARSRRPFCAKVVWLSSLSDPV